MKKFRILLLVSVLSFLLSGCALETKNISAAVLLNNAVRTQYEITKLVIMSEGYPLILKSAMSEEINGTINFANGGSYTGSYTYTDELQLLTGKLKKYAYNNGTYTGDLVNGEFVGTASIEFEDESVYEGQIIEWKPSGEGKLTTKEAIFTGMFLEGYLNGDGEAKYANEDVYKGEFVSGVPEGKGTLLYTDGNIYVGEFVAGLAEGKGTLTYDNSDYYKGAFLNGVRDGKGTYYKKTGDKIKGIWTNGILGGKVTITYKNGDSYKGKLVKGLKNGEGTYKYAGGDVYTGSWLKDKYSGKGTYTFKSGAFYIGKWVSGKLNGTAIYCNAKGVTYKGTWNDGSCIEITSITE